MSGIVSRTDLLKCEETMWGREGMEFKSMYSYTALSCCRLPENSVVPLAQIMESLS